MNKIRIILAGAAALAAITGCASTASAPKGSWSTPIYGTPAPYTPPAAATSTAPAAPQYTVSQQQAIDSAKSYLSDSQGFSYNSLFSQLTSSYGEGFSAADATFALHHISVDWYQQATWSAKAYMASGQGFSCSGLLQQLTSSYGEGFTHSQGEYGVKSVGLGTC
jgi:hypothetical protein